MTFAQLLAIAVIDDGEFNAGQPVSIPVQPFVTKGGFSIGFSAQSVNVKLPNGTLIASPLANDTIDLPLLGETMISAGDNAVILQKG